MRASPTPHMCCTPASTACEHILHITNLEHLTEVSKKVPSCNNIQEDERRALLTEFAAHLLNADLDDLHSFLPKQAPHDARETIDYTDLLAAAINTHLGQHLRTRVSTNVIHTNDDTAAQTLDDIAHIHSIGSAFILTFQLGPISHEHTLPALTAALPAELHCTRLITLLSTILLTTSTAQHTQTLRSLLHDVTLTPLDSHILDLGVGYARTKTHGIVCALTDAAINNAENTIRAYTHAARRELLQCETTYHPPTDDLAFLLNDLTSQLGKHTPPSYEGHADQILYVGKDGARVSVHQGRLIVNSPHELHEISLPCNLIQRIILTGNVGLSAGARTWALRNSIPVVFLSRRGSYQGHLSNAGALHAQRLIHQMEVTKTPEHSLKLARAIVQAKLRNQLHVLHRLSRRTPAANVTLQCQQIRALIDETSQTTRHQQLMGIEGAASEIYFATIPSLLPPETRFHGRSRRPPRDLANAALSYGYAILLSECVGALLVSGLEPTLGILHSATDKRPSLALDLMEEFRPLLVDSTVFALLRAKRLRPEHAQTDQDSGAVLLDPAGKKILTSAYEETLQRSVRGALPGFAGSWRRHITHEAQLLARAILDPSFQWVGVVWR